MRVALVAGVSQAGAPTAGPPNDDAVESAEEAGLRYVSDAEPGLRRVKRGRHFAYFRPNGERAADERTLKRIDALAIPPAWTDVWICRDARGHLQATGRDARGRKQYRYHPCWRQVRDEAKYDRMLAFAAALPRIRQRVDRDLGRRGLPREKVLATIVRLLDDTSIRIGNDEYRRENGSFGLTTLATRHVRVEGSEIRFKFRGKSGRFHRVRLADRRLAGIVKRIRDLPGQHLFQYEDEDGEMHGVGSDDVNAYLREVAGGDFTAKDFRTWNGTVAAMRLLCDVEPGEGATARRHQVVEAIERVAEVLGNTPAVCRKAYVHPAVLAAFEGGCLPRAPRRAESAHGLTADERSVVRLLRGLASAADDSRSAA